MTTTSLLPLLTKTPCKCWQLQEYTNLYPDRDENETLKGSFDSIMSDGVLLDDDMLEIGEAVVSSDGLMYPDRACKYFHSTS